MRLLLSLVFSLSILQERVLANTCVWYSLIIFQWQSDSEEPHYCFDERIPCNSCLPQDTSTKLTLWHNDDVLNFTNGNKVQVIEHLNDGSYTCGVDFSERSMQTSCKWPTYIHPINIQAENCSNYVHIECTRFEFVLDQDPLNICQSNCPEDIPTNDSKDIPTNDSKDIPTNDSKDIPANDSKETNSFVIIGSVLGSLVVLILSAILALQLIHMLRKRRRHLYAIQGASERNTNVENAACMYSGSMPGGPSPYDVNGAGGDGLYAELEPEKPDTPHTEWNDSPFTGALQERETKAACMYSPPLPGDPSPYECVVENGLHARPEPDIVDVVHSGCRTEDNHYSEQPARGEIGTNTENMCRPLPEEPSPHEATIAASPYECPAQQTTNQSSRRTSTREEKETLTAESEVCTPQNDPSPSGPCISQCQS